MNKHALKDALLHSLDEEISAALAAAGEAQATASHEDNKPENQYDTLALEAAYLAHGQSERILQLQKTRIDVSRWPVPELDADAAIRLGACVYLESVNDGMEACVFIAPIGGRTLLVDDHKILAVSYETPLARKLSGLCIDDEVRLTLGGKEGDWEVVEVC